MTWPTKRRRQRAIVEKFKHLKTNYISDTWESKHLLWPFNKKGRAFAILAMFSAAQWMEIKQVHIRKKKWVIEHCMICPHQNLWIMVKIVRKLSRAATRGLGWIIYQCFGHQHLWPLVPGLDPKSYLMEKKNQQMPHCKRSDHGICGLNKD